MSIREKHHEKLVEASLISNVETNMSLVSSLYKEVILLHNRDQGCTLAFDILTRIEEFVTQCVDDFDAIVEYYNEKKNEKS